MLHAVAPQRLGHHHLAVLPDPGQRAPEGQLVEAAAVAEACLERLAHALLAVLRRRPQQPRQRASSFMAAALALQQRPQPPVGLAQLREQLRRHLPQRLWLARELAEVVAVAHPPAAEALPRDGSLAPPRG